MNKLAMGTAADPESVHRTGNGDSELLLIGAWNGELSPAT